MSPFTSVSVTALTPPAVRLNDPPKLLLSIIGLKYYDMIIPLAARQFKYISKIFYVRIVMNAIIAVWTIMISGRPIINRLCLVL